MKKLVIVSLFAGMLGILVPGCKGKDKAAGGDPKAVTLAFFEAMSKKDIDGAAKYCTKESKATLDMMKKAIDAAEKMKGSGMENKDDGTDDFKDMVVGDAKINGDNATVAVTNKKKEETVEFPLKKEDGDWKVDFTMGTLMKMGMDAKKGKGENLFDDIKNEGDTTMNDLKNLLNSDTLKEKLQDVKEAFDTLKEGLNKLK